MCRCGRLGTERVTNSLGFSTSTCCGVRTSIGDRRMSTSNAWVWPGVCQHRNSFHFGATWDRMVLDNARLLFWCAVSPTPLSRPALCWNTARWWHYSMVCNITPQLARLRSDILRAWSWNPRSGLQNKICTLSWHATSCRLWRDT